MARIEAILQQRTHGSYGHFLNHRQAISHCGNYLYYDTRNADPEIIKTTRIESLELATNRVQVIYDTHAPSVYGPGVGAVVCHPRQSTILFIHGLTNCNSNQPYSATRRFGAWANIDPCNPTTKISSLESRSLQAELPWGTLGGGSHAHSFSSDGKWVSFTYNDALYPERRCVGFSLVDQWESVSDQSTRNDRGQHQEEFKGIGWSALAMLPIDPIESAREECWVQSDTNGVVTRQLAMIVQLRTPSAVEPLIDEIYLAKFPRYADDWPTRLGQSFQSRCISGADSGKRRIDWRLEVPDGIQVRRLTQTTTRSHPGVQGPRHWLIGSNCGRWIYTMMRGTDGIIRLVRVSVIDGSFDWISENQESITHPAAIDEQNLRIAYLAGKNLTILNLPTGQEDQVHWDSSAFDQIVGPIQFLKNSQGIFWSAYPSDSPWLQIWTATLQ